MERTASPIIEAALKLAIIAIKTNDIWLGVGGARIRLPAGSTFLFDEETRKVTADTTGSESETIYFDAADIDVIGISKKKG